MRTNVVFRHPAALLPAPDYDGVLSAEGAAWFAEILRRVPGLQIDGELCQEDWGVVLFARRDGKRFWIGISAWPDDEQLWLAHVHHASWAWLQRFSSSGEAAFRNLALDLHQALSGDFQVSDIAWFEESEMTKADAVGAATPQGKA